MVKALTNVLLLPWPGIQDQRWDERQRHVTKFLRDMSETFRSIRLVADFSTNKELQIQGKYSRCKKDKDPYNISTIEMGSL